MTPPRAAVWREVHRQYHPCWLCDAYHKADYSYLLVIDSPGQGSADTLGASASSLVCQKCGGRLCTGPHHGTKPCKARQLATKMCREGWVSVRRFYDGERRPAGRGTSAAKVYAEILKLFGLPAKLVQSRYAGTVGVECWTNDKGRDLVFFVQYTAHVLKRSNPVMARLMLDHPELVKEYRAALNLGARPDSLTNLLDTLNRDGRGKRRLSVGQLASNIEMEARRED